MGLKHITPHNSIRSFCLDCMGFNVGLVKSCTTRSCLFYPYRFDKRPYPKPKVGTIKSIRLKCLECVGSLEEVTKCTNLDCSIHFYRNRKLPSRRIKKTEKKAVILVNLEPGQMRMSF